MGLTERTSADLPPSVAGHSERVKPGTDGLARTSLFTSIERKILIVDWSENADSTLVDLLRKNSFNVNLSEGPDDVLSQVRRVEPSLILLAAKLLEGNAVAIFRQIRALSEAPIVVISDEGSDMDCVLGLGMGADDYVEKSNSSRVLIARLRASVRRYDESSDRIKAMAPTPVGRFVIRPGSNEIAYAGNLIQMSGQDFSVFQALFQSIGKVVSRERLLESIRQPRTELAIHALQTRIHRIRCRCEHAGAPPTVIRCIRNVGYALTES